MRKAVFLDRDGVVNRFPGKGKFVLNWTMFEFMPEVQESVRRLRQAGFFLALITNQSGVGRALMSMADLEDIHARMQEALAGDRLDAIYFCRHHPDEGCGCRKPSPKMIQLAVEEHGLDVAKSFLVGDSGRDIEMGRAAGCRTVLCRQNLPPSIESMEPRYQPHVFAKTLPEAVDWILSQSGA